jgi:hypothetical protein
MSCRFHCVWGVILISSCAIAAVFGQQHTGSAVPAQPVASAVAQKVPPTPSGLIPLSQGIGEILQMADAGVSKDVLETFIESSPIPYQLTSGDIIALKQKGIGDNITVAIMKHGAKLRAERAQAAAVGGSAAAQSVPAVYRASLGGLDPDSYQYFQYFYLHPRTLASVYQRLGVYGSPCPYAPYRALGAPYPGFGLSP